MTDLETAMAESLEGTFTRYPGYEPTQYFGDALGLYYYQLEKKVTGGRIRRHKPREAVAITMNRTLAACSQFFNTTIRDVAGQSRFPEHMRPRQIFFWFCRHHLGKTYQDIAAFLGRDHTTVIHSVKKIDRRMDLYTKDIEAIEQILGVE